MWASLRRRFERSKPGWVAAGLGGRIDLERDLAEATHDEEANNQRERSAANLDDLLQRTSATVDPAALERGFIRHAKAYSDSKGLTYTAWREAGVSAEILHKANIPRTRRS